MDTADHIVRVRQLAAWCTGQRWSDTDALLTMASLVGLMARDLDQPLNLIALFDQYASVISTQVSANRGASPEFPTRPAPRPDNGPPGAYASTLASPHAKISGADF